LRQYGLHVGGPILKDKIFFFFNGERYRFPGTAAYNRTILTDSARSGVYTWKDPSGALQNRNLYQLVGAATPPSGARYPTTPDPILAKTFADIAALSGNGVLRDNGPTTNDYNTRYVEFRAQALNVFNLTNFLPGAGNTSSTFGQVTSAYRDISGTVDPGGRILEFVLRINF